MAKLVTTKSYFKWPCLWKDPDTSKNRIFLDNHAYDYTTLAPRSTEIFYWQSRNNQFTHSATIDFDDWGPVQTGYMDGNAWSDGNSSIWAEPGLFDIWLISLDYNGGYRATRNWKSAGGRTILTYPRSGGTNDQNGDWWSGTDMNERSYSWRHGDTFFYTHIYEQVENLNFTIDSWSYSGTTITINKTAHGFFKGDTVTISGTTSTTNPPNGEWIVSSNAANSFTFVASTAPTGTAGGVATAIGTTYRGWGIETERDTGHKIVVCRGVNYTTDDNSTTAGVSRPDYTILNTGGNKFFLGLDNYDHIWFVRSEKTTTCGFSVLKYLLTGGQATQTEVLAASVPTGASSGVFPTLPSNIRAATGTRIVFYSGHWGTADLTPLRIVWDKSSASATATTCTMNYPSGSSFTDYSAVPTANTFAANGYNAYWSKPHQFTVNSINYITFCFVDKFIWSNTARLPTAKSRTWLTFTIGTGTGDDVMTFHSGYTFITPGDLPGSYVPYNASGSKLATFSNNGVNILTFDTTSFNADNWVYVSEGNQGRITVTKIDHGLKEGQTITTSGATAATSNPPNGVYVVESVVSDDVFTFVTDTTPVGAAGGTMNVKLGWQKTAGFNVRARGYGLDDQGRIWVTSRLVNTGRNEIHVLSETLPNSVSIKLQAPLEGSDTRYTYSGSTINTNLLVDALDVSGARVATTLQLTIAGDSMSFTGGQKTTQVTTNSSTSTSVAVSITGAGQTSITASVNI